MALKRPFSTMKRSFHLYFLVFYVSQGPRMLARLMLVKRPKGDPTKSLCARPIYQVTSQKLDRRFRLYQAEPASFWVELEQRTCVSIEVRGTRL